MWSYFVGGQQGIVQNNLETDNRISAISFKMPLHIFLDVIFLFQKWNKAFSLPGKVDTVHFTNKQT